MKKILSIAVLLISSSNLHAIKIDSIVNNSERLVQFEFRDGLGVIAKDTVEKRSTKYFKDVTFMPKTFDTGMPNKKLCLVSPLDFFKLTLTYKINHPCVSIDGNEVKFSGTRSDLLNEKESFFGSIKIIDEDELAKYKTYSLIIDGSIDDSHGNLDIKGNQKK